MGRAERRHHAARKLAKVRRRPCAKWLTDQDNAMRAKSTIGGKDGGPTLRFLREQHLAKEAEDEIRELS